MSRELCMSGKVGAMRPCRPAAGSRRGIAVVEFALIAPLLLVTIILVMQFGLKYYLVSVVHTVTFSLGQMIIDPATRPAQISTARSDFTSLFQSQIGQQPSSKFTLYVGPVSATVPTSAQPTADYFSVTALAPHIVRVVYPSFQLVDLSFMIPAWPSLFSGNVDVSVVVVPR